MRGLDPETLRAHTLKVGEELRDAATAEPATATAGNWFSFFSLGHVLAAAV
jgi:hypothetical protein